MTIFKKPEIEVANRIPHGQYLTDKFPVLTYGPNPKIDLKTWKLELWGEVEKPVSITWDEFLKLPQVTVTSDFHCVTRWSHLDFTWEGVSIQEFFKLVQPKQTTQFVLVHCFGGYTTNLPLEVLDDEDVLVAHHVDGKPLEEDHGGPARLVVPKRYAWKSAKWVSGLEFLSKDKMGFWEQYGYHNDADPWKEQRMWGD